MCRSGYSSTDPIGNMRSAPQKPANIQHVFISCVSPLVMAISMHPFKIRDAALLQNPSHALAPEQHLFPMVWVLTITCMFKYLALITVSTSIMMSKIEAAYMFVSAALIFTTKMLCGEFGTHCCKPKWGHILFLSVRTIT